MMTITEVWFRCILSSDDDAEVREVTDHFRELNGMISVWSSWRQRGRDSRQAPLV
jgi:hypothetical protein